MDPKLIKQLEEFEEFVDDFCKYQQYKMPYVLCCKLMNMEPTKPQAIQMKEIINGTYKEEREITRTVINQDERKELEGYEDVESRVLASAAESPSEVKMEKKSDGKSKSKSTGIDYSKWNNIDVEEEGDKDVGKKQKAAKPEAPVKGKSKMDDMPVTRTIVIRAVENMREEGNVFFKAGKYLESIDVYSQAIEICNNPPQKLLDDYLAANPDRIYKSFQKFMKLDSLQVDPRLWMNRAFAYLKLRKFQEALDDCECVLQKEPHNVKAMWRKIEAQRGLQQFSKAVETTVSLQNIVGDDKQLQIQSGITPEKLEGILNDLKADETESMNRPKDPTDYGKMRAKFVDFFLDILEQPSNLKLPAIERALRLEYQAGQLVEWMKLHPSIKTNFSEARGYERMFHSNAMAAESVKQILRVAVESARDNPSNLRQLRTFTSIVCSRIASYDKNTQQSVSVLLIDYMLLLSQDTLFLESIRDAKPHQAVLCDAILAALSTVFIKDTALLVNAFTLVEKFLTAHSNDGHKLLFTELKVPVESLMEVLLQTLTKVMMLLKAPNSKAEVAADKVSQNQYRELSCASRCLFELTTVSLKEARVCVLHYMQAITTTIFSFLVAIATSPSQLKQRVQPHKGLISDLMGTLHNVLVIGKESFEMPEDMSDVGHLLCNLCVAYAEEYPMVVRLMCRLARHDSKGALMKVISSRWDTLCITDVLTKGDDTVASQTKSNVLQLLYERIRLGGSESLKKEMACVVDVLKFNEHFDEVLIANAALCASEFASDLAKAHELVEAGLVKDVILYLRCAGFMEGTTRKNLGILCAKLCKVSQGLEEMRRLQGMELLYRLGTIL